MVPKGRGRGAEIGGLAPQRPGQRDQPRRALAIPAVSRTLIRSRRLLEVAFPHWSAASGEAPPAEVPPEPGSWFPQSEQLVPPSLRSSKLKIPQAKDPQL